jgi:hypothetical protein
MPRKPNCDAIRFERDQLRVDGLAQRRTRHLRPQGITSDSRERPDLECRIVRRLGLESNVRVLRRMARIRISIAYLSCNHARLRTQRVSPLTLNLLGLSNLLSKTNSFEMTEISSPYFPPSSVRGWICRPLSAGLPPSFPSLSTRVICSSGEMTASRKKTTPRSELQDQEACQYSHLIDPD